MQFLAEQVIQGLLVGSTYALVGLGFTFVWGVMRKFNLAYGSVALIGAYAVGVVYRLLGGTGPLAMALALAAAFVAGALAGWLTERISFRFLPPTNEHAPLMSTFGLLYILTETIDQLTAGTPQRVPNPVGFSAFEVGPLFIRQDLVATAVVAVVIMVELHRLVYRTPLGLATRAVSQQVTAAQLVGIGVKRTTVAVFMLTGVVGAVAGYLFGLAMTSVFTIMAFQMTGKGLVAAVIGGLGSFRGAVVGGLLLGVIEFVAMGYLGVNFRDIFAFLLLFVFLMIRPMGLFQT
jgi:branched-subunit amino acid ABC-type transport system permease component